ncbi:hypothetical protein [Thiomonas sp.]|uniref:hypothetical protein n=1 Tax=Thiomonas sp. TaxID=2047785 RepID=UPI002626A69C|nr:hypothetical protein [Thiomonas sp.]
MKQANVTHLVQQMRAHGIIIDVERGLLKATTAKAEGLLSHYEAIVNRHVKAVIENLRPPLATGRVAASARRVDPAAWDTAGAAIARAKRAASKKAPGIAARATRRAHYQGGEHDAD